MAPTHLVTGGGGFIGSHVVEGLLARGAAVRVFDDFSTGRRRNLDGLAGDVEVVPGDLRDPDAVRRAASGVDTIFHLGALPSVARSVADPLTSSAVNVGGTANVILAARDCGARRVIYASSSSVYGDPVDERGEPILPKVETMTPQPASPYAIQKLAGEHFVRVARPLYGVEAVSLRYFNVFGPRQDPKSEYAAVVPRFVTAMLRGEPPVIFGDGLQSRDFTYVEDVVAANLRAAEAPAAAVGDAFNVACGERFTLLDLARAIARLLGREDVAPRHEPPRPGDVRHSQASIEKARRVLGFEPKVGLEKGLRRTIAFYQGGGA